MGSSYQGNSHTTPDFSDDVWELITKNSELETLKYIKGRKASANTVDVIAAGYKNLCEKGIKVFAKRYKDFIRGGPLPVEVAEDGVPASSTDDMEDECDE